MTSNGITLVDAVAFAFAAFALSPLLARLGWRWWAGAALVATVSLAIAWHASALPTRVLASWGAGYAGLVLVGGGLTAMARLVDGEDVSVVFHVVAALAVVGALAYAWAGHARLVRERELAPAGIALGAPVAHTRAVAPPCGAAVWHVATTAPEGRDARAARIDYGPWRATPSNLALDANSPAARWFRGLACAGIDRDLLARIVDATREPGGWVAGQGAQGVMLLPSLGLYVHAWAPLD